MSANADPQSDGPRPPLIESVSGSGILSPRKLSRLLFDAERPFYVLDSQDRICFANRCLLDILKLSESAIDRLDCRRALAGDEHPQPAIAGLLAIPESARSSQMSFSPLGNTPLLTAPWMSRLVIPLDSPAGQCFVACLWLRADDPLVLQAAQHVDWWAQTEFRTALLDARRSLSRLDGLHSLIGNSPSAQLARRQTQAAIAGNMPICIYGPIGSRKATLARAIYQQRRKRERRLLAGGKLLSIDCRLMDRSLMQETIELATQSDTRQRPDTDHEPTAFLLSSIELLATDAFQALATFLTHHPTTSIFATSRIEDLHRLHADQAWQEIVAHINVMSIRLEPLSNRIEDIVPLLETILEEIRAAGPGNVRRFLSPTALQWLQAYPWPGNLRELSQALQDACSVSTTGVIEPHHFSLAIRTFPSHVLKAEPMAPVNLDQMLEDFERGALQKALAAFPRNRAAVARHLGISRARLLRRLAQLGLEAPVQEIEPTAVNLSSEATAQAQDEPIFEEIPDEPC